MNESILEKLKVVRSKVIEKFVKLSLFVVIKTTEGNPWDFVFAGNNLDNNDNLKIFVDIIRKELDQSEITSVSRIVLLNSDDSFAKNFNAAFSMDGENGYVTISNSQINNISIKEAYLFFSKKVY